MNNCIKDSQFKSASKLTGKVDTTKNNKKQQQQNVYYGNALYSKQYHTH